MYISEFLCGVFATVGIELMALVAYGIYLNVSKK